jgi:hypothetical protein
LKKRCLNSCLRGLARTCADLRGLARTCADLRGLARTWKSHFAQVCCQRVFRACLDAIWTIWAEYFNSELNMLQNVIRVQLKPICFKKCCQTMFCHIHDRLFKSEAYNVKKCHMCVTYVDMLQQVPPHHVLLYT